MSTTLKNPETYFNRVKQERADNTCYICCNLFGKIYELDVGETKTFPVAKIKGDPQDIGAILKKRYGFLEIIKAEDLEGKEAIAIDEGTESKQVTDDQIQVSPLLQIQGLGEKSVAKLGQAGVQTLDDWFELKKDYKRLEELLGELPARRFKNKQ